MSPLPELGHLALILALYVAVAQSLLALLGAWGHRILWMRASLQAARAQFILLLIAFGCLAGAFSLDDFSVAYVASNSNTALPWYYKLSAVWGAHEGSMLLWVLLLAAWGCAVSIFSKQLPDVMRARVLGVMGVLGIGFLLFVEVTSNPFKRLLPQWPEDGNDLNPLLQDIGLIVHPPLLYMGYVGFSVAFAFAIAALMGGRLDAAWARWSRPWTLLAWAFLTLGIVLGSWWAYYELGWGGWWFWDPVENASLMPWLVGTALLHSLIVTERRGVFKSWTVLLAIAAFSLSLLGTFLVRSGVLTSVHAFATDPERGFFILAFLLVVIGISLTLFAFRAPVVRSHVRFVFWSRETFLLINNLILVVVTAMIFLGTLYPLLVDALTGNKLSVGPPYFNALFMPLMALLLSCLTLGVFMRWKDTPLAWLTQLLVPVLVLALLLGLGLSLVSDFYWGVLAAFVLALWVLLGGLRDVLAKLRHTGLAGLWRLPASYWGMQIAHTGLACCALGIVLVSHYSAARDVRMAPGEQVSVGGYEFIFEGVKEREGPNYQAEQGAIRVLRDGQEVTVLHPEKRVYRVQRMPMTEAGIKGSPTHDLYVALGEPLGDGVWAVRIQVKAFVRWIWWGGLLIALGGLWALCDRRYRQRLVRRAPLQQETLT